MHLKKIVEQQNESDNHHTKRRIIISFETISSIRFSNWSHVIIDTVLDYRRLQTSTNTFNCIYHEVPDYVKMDVIKSAKVAYSGANT